MTTWFADLPIQQKLVAIGVAASSLALVLACTAFVAYDRTTFRTSIAEELATQARIIGRNSSASILFEDAGNAERILDALRAEESILEAAIYKADGGRFAGYKSPSKLSTLPLLWLGDAEKTPFAGGVATVREAIVFDGELLGSVVIRASLAELDRRTARFGGIALAVLLLSLIVAFAVSTRLQRTIAEPLLRLRETAATISREKDYSIRAEAAGNDEIGFLVQTFNAMLSRIQDHERELESARDAALAASRLKTAFLANMSHEIRTPLNVILGYNDLIAEHFATEGNSGYLSMVSRVRGAGGRLTTTINGVLDLSRMEADAFDLHLEIVDVAKVIDAAVGEARVLAEAKHLELSCEIETEGLEVLFDEYCLSQTLLNLLSNAIKFTQSGGVHVRLFRGDDSLARLVVSDSGVGIDREYLANLFEPFTQESVGQARQFEGSGLGLALVRRYVTLNGCEIAAASTKDVGSTFTLTFSRECEEKAAVGAVPPVEILALPVPVGKAPPAVTDERNGRLLIVEDDPDSQQYLCDVLESEWQMFRAATAEDAMQQLATYGPVDAILLDVSLKGGIDGLTLTRRLRAATWSDLPIIAVTAHAFREDKARCLEAGCDAYLAKPVDVLELREVLARLLSSPPPISALS